VELFGGDLGYLCTWVERPNLHEVALVTDGFVTEFGNTFPRFRIGIFDIARSVDFLLAVIKGLADHESGKLFEEIAECVKVASELRRAAIEGRR
jgi:hypothetical protein